MGIRYDGMKLNWLSQRAGTGVTIDWTSPSSDLGSFFGNETVSIQLRTLVINGVNATYSLASGTLPGGLTIAGNFLSGRLYNTTGSYAFTIRASSGTGNADQIFTANVATVQAPVWVTNSGAIGSAYETTLSNVTVTATDPQDLPLTYNLIAGTLPTGFALDTNAGVLRGTLAAVGGDTMFSFTIAANNSLLATNRGFSYTVKSNEAPEWTTNGIGGDGTFTILGAPYEGSTVNYPVSATNYQEDETLTYSLVIGAGLLPDGLTFDAANAVVTGTLPILTSNANYVFVLRASDGVKFTDHNFEIQVLHNYPPIWNSNGILAVGLGGSYIDAVVSAYDVNGNAITYALDANSSLPGTLTFDAANAAVVGDLPYVDAPTNYYFNLIANNGTVSTTRNFGVTAQRYQQIVWDTPAGSLGTGVEGDLFNLTLSATSTTGHISYNATNTAALPSGFTLNAVTGAFTGTWPTVETDTTYDFDIIANDGIQPSTRSFSLTDQVNIPPVWVTNAGLLLDAPTGYVENIALIVSDPSDRVVSYTISSGSLPPGLSLSATGVIGGKMTLSNATATYDFTVLASNGSVSNAQAFSIIAEANLPPVWTTNSGLIGSFTEQTPMSYTFAATDPENYQVSFSVVNAAALPAGVILTSNGVLSGTTPPEVANATFNFTLMASDGAQTVNENFSIAVINATPPIWQSNAVLANAVEDIFYSIQFVANGATSFDVNSGTTPAGLSFYSNGVLAGIPTDLADTAYSLAIDASNGIRYSTRNFTLAIRENEAPTWTSNTVLANALGGTIVNVQLRATDRNALPITYVVANGSSLPSGINVVANTGLVSGALPISVDGETYSFTLGADNGYYTGFQDFTMIVQPNQPPVWQTAGGLIGNGVASLAFTAKLVAEDPENLILTVTNTTPMPGTLSVSVSADQSDGGAIIPGSNTVTVSGILPFVSEDTNFPFTLAAYDGYETTTRDFSVDVVVHQAPVWITNAGVLADVYSGETFTYTLSASSPNDLHLTYTVNSGTLPGTLVLSSAGNLSGTLPIDVSNTSYSFTVTVSDGTLSVDQSFSILNMPNLPPVWVTSNSSPVASQYETTNAAVTFVATDPENRGITYMMGTNNFPSMDGSPAFGINALTGVMTGTFPSVLSDTTYTFTIIALDYQQVNQTSQVFTMVNIFDQVPIWTTAGGSLGSATEATSFTTTVVANAGADAVTYAVSNGALPSGLTLDGTSGVISGTLPTVTQDTESDFTITASDTAKSADQSFSITTLLQRPPVWTTPAGTLVSQFAGNTFNATVVATSPNDLPLTYTEISDGFPTGISFNPNTQVITGTLPYVNNNATYPITVSVSDGSISVTRTFDIINKFNPAPTWTTNAIANVVENVAYSFALTATNAYSGTVIYGVANGTSLPTGLTLSANTGVISGKVANAPVDTTTTVIFSASNGFFDSYETLPITVRHDLPPTWVTASGSLGTSYELANVSVQLSATDPIEGNAVSYSLATGTLPTGLIISNTGLIHGTTGAVTNTTISNFTVNAATTRKLANSLDFSFTVNYREAPQWVSVGGNTNLIADGVGGTTFPSYTFVANANVGTLTYVAANTPVTGDADGLIPTGLHLLSNGLLYGAYPVVNASIMDGFQINVTDSGTGKSNSMVFYMETTTSTPPTWVTAAGNVFTSKGGTTFSVPLLANATDNASISFSYLSGTLPGGVTISTVSNGVGSISGTLPLVQNNTNYTANVVATDGYSTAVRTFTITAETAPIWNTVVVANAISGAAYLFTLATYDPNGLSVTYMLNSSTLPSGLSLNANTGVISGTGPALSDPNNSNADVYVYSIDANDGFVTNTFTFTQYVESNAVPSTLRYTWRFNDPTGSGNISSYIGNNSTTPLGGSIYSFVQAPAPYSSDNALFLYELSELSTPTGTDFSFLTSGNWTVELWVYTANTPSNGETVFSVAANSTANDFRLNYNNAWEWFSGGIGSPNSYGGSGGVTAVFPSGGSTGWNHLAVVKNGTKVTGYLNGNGGNAVTVAASISSTYYNSKTVLFNGIQGNEGLSSISNVYVRGANMWSTAKYISNFVPVWDDFYAPVWDTANANTLITSYESSAFAVPIVAETFAKDPISYSAVGSLPSGISLAANGLVYGTLPVYVPNASSVYFTVTATDATTSLATDSRTFSVTSNSAAPNWTSNSNLGLVISGGNYANSVAAISPVGGSVTYGVDASSSMPGGLSIAANGLISGTNPVVSNTTPYTFVLDATANGLTATQTFTLTVRTNTPPTWITSPYALGNSGVMNANNPIAPLVLSASDIYSDPITYTLSNATPLPTGLTMTGNTISGTPTVVANTTFDVAAINNFGGSTTQTFYADVLTSGSDPYLANVTLLLPMSGTVGSPPAVAYGSTSTIGAYNTSPLVSSTVSKWGTTSTKFLTTGYLEASTYVAMPSAFTVEFWVYVTATPQQYQIFFSAVTAKSGTDGFIIGTAGTTGAAQPLVVRDSAGTISALASTAAVTFNTWHFITVSRDSTNTYLFMNGTLLLSPLNTSLSTYLNTIAPASTHWAIGGYDASAGAYQMDGYMSDLRVTNGICRYSSSFTPPSGPFPTQ